MNEKKLIDLYKKQLAQSQEKAPEGLWENIAREMDTQNEKQLISQYKKELEQSAEKAPEGLWNDIARKMDIDEIWEGVSAGLREDQKRKGGFLWFNRGIAAAIAVLLVSSLSVWFVGKLSTPDAEFAVTETELTTPVYEGGAEETLDVPIPTQQPEFTITITGRNGKDDALQEVTETAIASLQEQEDTFEEENQILSDLQESNLALATPAFNPLTTTPASLPTTAGGSLQQMSSHGLQDEDSEYDFSLPEADAGSGMLALGFTAAMKNTWLFNHETFQGFNSGSGSVTQFQVYPDVAVSLRYSVSERWNIESSLSFSSNTGQSYEQYIFGRYSQREIALNYFNAEVLAGYNHRKRWVVRSNTISHSSSLGLYYGVLNAANEIIAGKKEDVSTLYRRDDYGIVTGHNLSIPVIGNLMFSPGIYFTWGLPNIYQGEHILPSLKRTRNSSVELRFSLYYNFAK